MEARKVMEGSSSKKCTCNCDTSNDDNNSDCTDVSFIQQ